MNNKLIPFFLTLASLFLLSFVGWFVIQQHFLQKDNSTNGSNTTKETIDIPEVSLSDICDCYLVTGNVNPYLVIDGATGQFVNFLPITKGEDEYPPRMPYISASGTQFSAITESGKSIEYRSGITGNVKTIFQAPSGKIVNWITWAGDENTLLIGLGDEEGLQPTEGARPTQIIAIEPNGGATSTIISRTELKEKGIEEIYPLASTSGANKILLSSGGMDEQKFWMWTRSTSLQEFKKNTFIGSIYFSVAHSSGQSKLLTYDQGLHVIDLETEMEIVYPITGWSDSPMSQPSPNGQYVVYLKKDQAANRGYPTLLSLANGQERRLSSNAVGEKGSLAGSFWSPDGTYLAYNRDYSKPSEYSVVDIQLENQTPKLLVLPSFLRENTIYRLITKK